MDAQGNPLSLASRDRRWKEVAAAAATTLMQLQSHSDMICW